MIANSASTSHPVIEMLAKNLLFEILEGEIKEETRRGIFDLGDLREIPGLPARYRHLFSYVQGASVDNKELAHDLLDELRVICIDLKESKQ
jgi:hypothetical protein